MKKCMVLLLLLTVLSGQIFINFSTDIVVGESSSITWINMKDYYFSGSWNDLLFFVLDGGMSLRIYNDQGKRMLEENNFISMVVFEDFIAVERVVFSPNYDHYFYLASFGETEKIRAEALNHVYIEYEYDYYDKTMKKIKPQNEIVKLLSDGYSVSTFFGLNFTGSYSQTYEKRIYDKYYLVNAKKTDNHEEVGLADYKGNVLIEPSYSLITAYYNGDEDEIYFILYESAKGEFGQNVHYITKVMDESMKVVYNVPKSITSDTYVDAYGNIIFKEDSNYIRAFTLKGDEILKGISKRTFYEKDGWYYILEYLGGNFYNTYKLNVNTNEKLYFEEHIFPGNVGVVYEGFDYFYYKRLDGGNPDIKFQAFMAGYYFDTNVQRICAFSNVEGYVSNFVYDASYGYLGKKKISNDLIIVRKNGKVGLLDNTYKELSKFIYDDIDDTISSDRIVSTKDGKYGYLDSNGNEVIPFVYKKVGRFNKYGYAFVETDNENKMLIDRYGSVIFESKSENTTLADYSDINRDYVVIVDNNRIGWIKNYIFDPSLYLDRISSLAKETVE